MNGHMMQSDNDELLTLEGLLLMGDLEGAAASSTDWLLNHASGERHLSSSELQRALAVAAQSHWLTGRQAALVKLLENHFQGLQGLPVPTFILWQLLQLDAGDIAASTSQVQAVLADRAANQSSPSPALSRASSLSTGGSLDDSRSQRIGAAEHYSYSIALCRLYCFDICCGAAQDPGAARAFLASDVAKALLREHDQAALLGEVAEAEAQLAATKQATTTLKPLHSQGPAATQSAGASVKGGAPAPAGPYNGDQTASAAGGLQQYLAPQGALCTMLGDPGEEEELFAPTPQQTAKGALLAAVQQGHPEIAAGADSRTVAGGPIAPQTPESSVTARISDRDRRLEGVQQEQRSALSEITPADQSATDAAAPASSGSGSLYAAAKAALHSVVQQVNSLWGAPSTSTAPAAASAQTSSPAGLPMQGPQKAGAKQNSSHGGVLGLALAKADGGGGPHNSGQLRDVMAALLVAACVIALYKERKVLRNGASSVGNTLWSAVSELARLAFTLTPNPAASGYYATGARR